MEKIRQKMSTRKNSSKRSSPTDDETYLEPEYDQLSSITIHLDSIAQQILAIAKKSVENIFFFAEILFRSLSESHNSAFETSRWNFNRQTKNSSKVQQTNQRPEIDAQWNKSSRCEKNRTTVSLAVSRFRWAKSNERRFSSILFYRSFLSLVQLLMKRIFDTTYYYLNPQLWDLSPDFSFVSRWKIENRNLRFVRFRCQTKTETNFFLHRTFVFLLF